MAGRTKQRPRKERDGILCASWSNQTLFRANQAQHLFRRAVQRCATPRPRGASDRKYPVRLNYAQLPSVRDLC